MGVYMSVTNSTWTKHLNYDKMIQNEQKKKGKKAEKYTYSSYVEGTDGGIPIGGSRITSQQYHQTASRF